MRRIKTVNGFKLISSRKKEEIEDQVQDYVSKHRATLISSIVNGLPQYIDYKFHRKLNSTQRNQLVDTLNSMSKLAVPIDDCEELVKQLMRSDNAVAVVESA